MKKATWAVLAMMAAMGAAVGVALATAPSAPPEQGGEILREVPKIPKVPLDPVAQGLRQPGGALPIVARIMPDGSAKVIDSGQPLRERAYDAKVLRAVAAGCAVERTKVESVGKFDLGSGAAADLAKVRVERDPAPCADGALSSFASLADPVVWERGESVEYIASLGEIEEGAQEEERAPLAQAEKWAAAGTRVYRLAPDGAKLAYGSADEREAALWLAKRGAWGAKPAAGAGYEASGAFGTLRQGDPAFDRWIAKKAGGKPSDWGSYGAAEAGRALVEMRRGAVFVGERVVRDAPGSCYYERTSLGAMVAFEHAGLRMELPSVEASSEPVRCEQGSAGAPCQAGARGWQAKSGLMECSGGAWSPAGRRAK